MLYEVLHQLYTVQYEVTKIGTIRTPTSEMLSTWELWLSKRCSPLCPVSRTRCWLQCPQRRCVSESSPGVTSLADEDCSKDLIMDTCGADPTLVSSLAASSNILNDNFFAAKITTKNATYGPHINTSCATFLPLSFTVFDSLSQELSTHTECGSFIMHVKENFLI
jgi:hypothetical protein